MRRLTPAFYLLAVLLAGAASRGQTSHWPAQDGNYVIKNFHFGSGESIPELKLHYLTLGKPHRDAAGHNGGLSRACAGLDEYGKIMNGDATRFVVGERVH